NMIKNNKGVTLVELLIVIVILGIIAAVSIPAVGNIVDNAQRDAFGAEANNIRSAATTYCAQSSAVDACQFTAGDGSSDYLTSEELGLDIDAVDYAAWLNGDGDWEIAIVNFNGYDYFGTVADLDTSSDLTENSGDTTVAELVGTTATDWNGVLA
ncbi:MAG: prepilin-type N-terminal cleavage/methylation domain-containing protein, partial [Bacillota bacterium]